MPEQHKYLGLSEEALTTKELRRAAQNERLISRNQRGHTADLLDWAAQEIEHLQRVITLLRRRSRRQIGAGR